MPSVIIAAHNEGAVIARCLDALTADAEQVHLDITVAANGCTDDTAEVARRYAGVRVLELPEPGKAPALNAAERVAVGFPRVYLDADIVLTSEAVWTLCDALQGGYHAAVPRRELALDGRPLLVRAYYAISARLPVFQNGLVGRGAITISADGHHRFERFPDMVADDLFLDSLFAPDEKAHVNTISSRVETPRRSSDLFRRLVRIRRANAAMRAASHQEMTPSLVRPRDGFAWLFKVVLPHPSLLPAAVVYVAMTLAAAVQARCTQTSNHWGRDESSRVQGPFDTHHHGLSGARP